MNQQQLIEENINLVYFVIHKYYPNLIKDEDIVQLGMLALCKAANTWDESISKFSGYACRCIGYEINNELKHRKRQINTISLATPVKGDNGKTDDLSNFIVGEEDIDYVKLQPFYDKLNSKEQDVFALLHNGLTPKEIAKKLGISRTTVYFYVRRLRTLWRDYYGD
jgi:RNA polymerase sporulation-specific sigma factor